MDTFVAVLRVGASDQVVGIDMTDAQLAKAERLRDAGGFGQVSYRKGHISNVPLADEGADVVLSSSVINLAPDKAAVFRKIARLLKPGGRLALSDTVTETELPDSVTGDSNLWAACIAGAIPQGRYWQAIESSGLTVRTVRDNPSYRFLSEGTKSAKAQWGAKSISLLALKP